MKFKPAGFFFLAVLYLSCSKGPSHITPSFYYWSTKYAITGADSGFLEQSGCRKMYVRFFDVGYGNSWDSPRNIVPMGRLEQDHPFIGQVETVPVVYLENRIFQGPQTEKDLRWLCSKITTKLFRMARNHGLPQQKIKEVQLDCDWTAQTRGNYFRFLQLFKEQCGNKKLSVTLRLYQYKYRKKSGIPPVDRCMLMYYNMSDLKDLKTRNYILDNATGKKYINNVEVYPLPLDFALPIYSQGVEFYTSDSTFYGLRNMTMADTVGQKILSVNLAAGSMMMKDKNADYSFMRFEYVTPKNLLQAAQVLAGAINTDTFSVSFFQLDEKLYNSIGHETFDQVIDYLYNSH